MPNPIRPSNNVNFRMTDDGGVVLDTTTGRFYGLNPTAATVWSSLADGGGVDDAVDAMLAAFAIDEATARKDTMQVVDQFRMRGLLREMS
jgi:hypothetical protein